MPFGKASFSRQGESALPIAPVSRGLFLKSGLKIRNNSKM